MSGKEIIGKEAVNLVGRVVDEVRGVGSEGNKLLEQAGALLSGPGKVAPSPEIAAMRTKLDYSFTAANPDKMQYPTMEGFAPGTSLRQAAKAAIAEAQFTEAESRLPVLLKFAKPGEPTESVFAYKDSSVMSVKWDWRATRDESIMRNQMAGLEDNRSMSLLGRASLGYQNLMFRRYFG